MKQHIKLEQLQEFAHNKSVLGFVDFYRLVRNDKKTTVEAIQRFYKRLRLNETKGFDSLLNEITIGKMIEILNNGENAIDIVKSLDDKLEKVRNEWVVMLGTPVNVIEFAKTNLCDALWEAVLYYLEG